MSSSSASPSNLRGRVFAADATAGARPRDPGADFRLSSSPPVATTGTAMQYAAVGVSGEDNILNLDLGRRLHAVATPAEAVELAVAEQAEAHERSAGLALAPIGAANGDPELDRYLTELTASATGQNRRVLSIYRDRGWLRDQLPFDELVEMAAVLASVDTFIRVTRHDGWPMDRYRTWLRRMMTEFVFVAPQSD